jgi:hypothetical protein
MYYITADKSKADDVKAHQEYHTDDNIQIITHPTKQMYAVEIVAPFEGCVNELPEGWR